ncbi:hypothetical protein ACIQUQ_00840 [Streptomyces sp. NPDC101118]|uniref:hypothetical protein n=1 Tax=Streptomyces sp. NPDC101118 TaxID=3366109 RepID=UPI0037F3A19A
MEPPPAYGNLPEAVISRTADAPAPRREFGGRAAAWRGTVRRGMVWRGTVWRRTRPLLPGLVALCLGLWGLERGPAMWRDESVTHQVAHRTAGELWALLGHVDAVHGLYYFLMHAVFGVWDGGLWALRLPSVLATAAAAYAVAAIAGTRAGPRAAAAAGTAYAVLPPVQQYAQEGRSYALVAAAVVWATYALLRGRWVAYAGLLLLACWLHQFALLALAAHAVVAWRTRAWRWCALAVAAGVLPLALVAAGQAGAQLGWLGRPAWQDWLAYAVAAGAGLLLARGAERERVRVALPLLLLPPGVLLAVSLVHPWYVDRYVLYALAGLALLVSRWRVVLLVAVLGLPWSLWLRTPESRKDDAVAVAAAVRELSRPGDGVLFLPARRREWLLSSPEVYGGLRDLALARSPAASGTLQGTELPSTELRAALLDSPRVIALSDPPDQPRDRLPREAVKRQILVAHFDLCTHRHAHGAAVALYARPGECPHPPRGR